MTATGTGVRSRPRAALPALCVTQITSWGILYYAFPVLNPATAGSVLGVLSLLTVGAAPNLAVLTRWWAPDHIHALTVVTLAGGPASTLYAPLTAVLADHTPSTPPWPAAPV